MKAFQELTEWSTEFDMPNHVYFLNDSKDKMYGYVQSGTSKVRKMSKPYKFNAKGRTFKEVANRWNFVVEEEKEVTVGKEYRVPGKIGRAHV